MKYIEPVKSIVLFLLVMLSIALTFTIWTYTPDYRYIEQVESKEILVGSQKNFEDLIRPYKAVYRFENGFTGTVSNSVMKDLMKMWRGWNVFDLRIDSNLSANYMNEMIRTDKRMTVFFTGEIPFSVLSTTFQFTDKELPETTFNRMIIDWSHYANRELQVFFVSNSSATSMRAHVSIQNAHQFMKNIIEPAEKYGAFQEIERENATSLYIAKDTIESVKYTYFINDLSPELFKNVLFTEPNIVRSNMESPIEKYTDGMSEMTVDTNFKSLNYVYPAAESSVSIEPSKLLKDSFEFINEHGGFTADYRYISLGMNQNQIDYQLFLQGLPVYSDQLIYRMSTIWGDNRIFHYKRPYFSLDIDIPSEKEIKELPSGVEIIDKIHQMDNIMVSDIDELTIGYYLTQNQSLHIFTLEPCWLMSRNGKWTRVTPELFGGVKLGLE
ncbi:YycH family regulatory protein [Lysinibacillus piscis]|uniref:Regulatory protein YycH domain-containing protein n=1 Tax=Lysinibacillus piscis TaxID=2518931 RepID=A0ABQ5NPN5_9BACI|nr:two-component system activity regulator YycH [Lysinibacillus sp. KH24]GLC90078.1 hypothetical protein LYSBPC_32050 [Lysinibacillus sp. KH24]